MNIVHSITVIIKFIMQLPHSLRSAAVASSHCHNSVSYFSFFNNLLSPCRPQPLSRNYWI